MSKLTIYNDPDFVEEPPKPKKKPVDNARRKVKKSVSLRKEIWEHVERIRKQRNLKTTDEALESLLW